MKRVFCLLLTLVLLVGMVPVKTQATETDDITMNNGNVDLESTNSFGALLSQDLNEELAEETGGYNILDLTIAGNVAVVEYDSLEEATLVVAIYTEDGEKLLTSGHTVVDPEMNEATVTIEGEMPEYFMASAYLVDNYDYSPLCISYDTPMYTKEMQDLLASTVDDYDPDLVLNFDDDKTTNFAVFAEETVIIEEKSGVNTVASADDDTMTYVIENADEQFAGLQAGDVVAYPYGDEQLLIVKVASIKVNGTTVTIKGAELEMEEVFTHVKMEHTGDAGDMEVDESTCVNGVVYEGMTTEGPSTYALRAAEGNVGRTHMLNFKFLDTDGDKDDEGNVSAIFGLTGTIGLKLDINFAYYISLSRQFVEFKTDVGLQANLKFEAGVEGKFPIPKLKFTLYGLGIGFEPEFKFEVKATVELSFFAGFTFGFTYERGKGFRSLNGKPTVDADFKVEGSVFIGLDLAPTVDVAGGAVMEGKIEVPIGFELTAERAGTMFQDPDPSASVLHQCQRCIAMKLVFKAELVAKLKFLKSKKLEFSSQQLRFDAKIGDMYWSWDNGDFGWGTCPYQTYKVAVRVSQNEENSTQYQSDILVQAECEETGTNQVLGATNASGLVSAHLAPGTYTFKATMNGVTISTTKKIIGACQVALHNKLPKTEENKISSAVSPDAVVDNGKVIASGDCGLYDIYDPAYLPWKLYENGTLRISGNGQMQGYYATQKGPWADYKYKIKKVVIGNGVTNVSAYAFKDCTNLKEVVLPDTVSRIESDAFYNCYNLEKINLPKNLNYIGSLAFAACSSLTSLTIPSKVRTIDSFAFDGCENLKEVTLPEGLKTIYRGAFVGCYALEKINLPSSLTTLDSEVFCYTALTSVTIPDGITSIKYGLFGGCKNLKSVTIPSSVTEIVSYAFDECESLTDIYYGGTADQWKNVIVSSYYNEALLNATVHCSGGTVLASTAALAAVAAEDEVVRETVTEQRPAQDAVYGGESETTETNGYTIKTAKFSGLVPGEEYLLLVIADLNAETPVAADNLLYIDQAAAGEDGKLSFTYAMCTEAATAYVMACGAANKDLKDADIIFWEMTSGYEEQVVEPYITYQGTALTIGVDYEILGQTAFTDAGEYICYIRGINDYTGLVECPYTVVRGGILGDLNGDDSVNDDDVILLLWHTLLPDLYSIEGDADFTADGSINDEDVIYLLWHTLLPDLYPL